MRLLINFSVPKGTKGEMELMAGLQFQDRLLSLGSTDKSDAESTSCLPFQSLGAPRQETTFLGERISPRRFRLKPCNAVKRSRAGGCHFTSLFVLSGHRQHHFSAQCRRQWPRAKLVSTFVGSSESLMDRTSRVSPNQHIFWVERVVILCCFRLLPKSKRPKMKVSQATDPSPCFTNPSRGEEAEARAGDTYTSLIH